MFLEKFLMGPLGTIAQLKVVRGIMGAGLATIPFTIVGSMFLVFNVLPLTFPVLENFFNETFFRFSDLYMLANTMSMGILALFFNISLGYEYSQIIAEDEDLDLNGLNGALLSMFAFFMTIPELLFEDGVVSKVTELNDGASVVSGWRIGAGSVERLGTTGIFTGIIMAIVAVNLYKLCVRKKWIIKLPEEVPAGVSRAFTALIPAFFVAFVVLLLNAAPVVFNTDLFKLIQIPFGFVTELTNSWLGVMVIYFLVHALWLVGIHGANIIFALITPITLANLASNAAGANIPLAGEFNNAFVTVGGSGATLLLTFFIAFLAKSKQLKAIGKAAMIPALFNINEPLVFGLPLIYNPYLAIPFFLAPMVSASIAYFSITMGLIDPLIALLPWPSPVGIGAYIGTGGDWRAIIVALIGVVSAFIIYYPFIKAYDKELVRQETGATA
ncbi:PTS cellobiose transporter subunit IIC [Alkalibacterium sp. 20]|uniref:PTS cellobiose transporter subunit IIC n=1 Tax=Alkalibacterium sp. 20 TaxID=1798803 RepID=UPI002109435F|nr:PTS cellobiose transporter subunit IIC [Alkalibacterium sp. 20]